MSKDPSLSAPGRFALTAGDLRPKRFATEPFAHSEGAKGIRRDGETQRRDFRETAETSDGSAWVLKDPPKTERWNIVECPRRAEDGRSNM